MVNGELETPSGFSFFMFRCDVRSCMLLDKKIKLDIVKKIYILKPVKILWG